MVDNHIITKTSYKSIVHISDESKTNKTFFDISSSSSFSTSSSSERSKTNNSTIYIKYNNLSNYNKKSQEKMDQAGHVQPVYKRINENCYEEIFYAKHGEHDLETRIINQKNYDGSVDRTTITTTFFKNGEVKQEAFVESIFEENFCSSDSSLEKENSDKKNYQLLYALTKRQFDLMEVYFKKLQHNGYIQKNELKMHILFQVKERKNVCKVNEDQICRAIDSIENSKDGFIDFNGFIQFMSLFFSSKYNIKRKITSVLNGQSYSHFEPGFLQKNEANDFKDYLLKFYGISQPLKFEEEKISYEAFAELIYPIIKKHLFIKWTSRSQAQSLKSQ